MNGTQSLFKVLTEAGLDTCFANPGTSEMQLVYEMGKSEQVRPVLCLQENVVTGAADGYARMAGKPAFTLLHVGSGFANGIANLHNAGRAHTSIVNIVGANATYHQALFPEHELIGGKISELARAVSHWTREARSAAELAVLGAEAVRNACTGAGRISTLITPTDCHWESAPDAPVAETPPPALRVSPAQVEKTARQLSSGGKTGLLLGASALHGEALELAGRIAAGTGTTLLGETFPARLSRGAGCVQVQLIPYLPEMAQAFLAEYRQIILVGALKPVATFAYQGAVMQKLPEECELSSFATPDHDIVAALTDLVQAVGDTGAAVSRYESVETAPPTGALTPAGIGQSITLLMPEGAIMVEEGATASIEIFAGTQRARRHDYLYSIPGAAIGAGLPVTLGVAVACPERKVVTLQADGSAMYTPQALWSIARENCDAIIVVLKNNAYAILNVELARVRRDEHDVTPKMQSMMDLTNPSIDWVGLAESMGVPAVSVATAEAFHEAFAQGMSRTGPLLIEANIEQDVQPLIDMILQGKKAG
jgi:acetolactate synthase-1/2/3 large subunit